MRPRSPLLASLVAASALALAGCAGPPYLPARSAPPPPEAPPTVEHGSTFLDAGGVRLFEQWWRPRTAGPPRGVVVLVHGLKDHSSRYAELATHLVDDGFAVYAFDLRGHGHSSGVRVDVLSFEDYLHDLDAVIEQARGHEPNVPVFLFGHSMGGAIATLWTLERKAPLAGLILSGPALEPNVPGIKIFGTRAIAFFFPGAEVFQLDLADFSRDKQVVREAATDLLVYQDAAPARTAKELLNAMGTIQDRMGELTVPLLAMHGTADVVTDPQGSKDLVTRAASRDKTLALWPGLVHDLLHEPEKAQVMKTMIDWIDARGTKRAAPAPEPALAPAPAPASAPAPAPASASAPASAPASASAPAPAPPPPSPPAPKPAPSPPK